MHQLILSLSSPKADSWTVSLKFSVFYEHDCEILHGTAGHTCDMFLPGLRFFFQLFEKMCGFRRVCLLFHIWWRRRPGDSAAVCFSPLCFVKWVQTCKVSSAAGYSCWSAYWLGDPHPHMCWGQYMNTAYGARGLRTPDTEKWACCCSSCRMWSALR